MGGISDRQVGFWDISRLVVAQQFGKDLIDACELIGVVRLDCLGEMGASTKGLEAKASICSAVMVS